jgi:D-alanyl-D-alanine carboxypeptidase (penicillin-binding protein 5/6)
MVVQSVMAAPDLWADAQKLLAYGVDNFENVLVARKGEVVGTVPIQAGYNRVVEVISPRDVTVCLPRGAVESANLQQVWQLPDELTAPVNENQPVGQLIVRQGDKVLTTVPLVAAQAVPVAATPWEHISSWFFPGMLAASVLSLFRLQEVRKQKKVRRRVRKMPKTAQKRPVGSMYKAS